MLQYDSQKLVSLVTCITAVSAASPDGNNTDEKRVAEWKEFKKTYNKTYSSREEEAKRYKIFVKNSEFVEKHNAEEALDGRYGYEIAIYAYADRTPAEMICRNYEQQPDTSEDPIFLAPSGVTLNETVDWRKKGYVTGVKNQGQCGSCYSFSATGSLEGQHFKKTGKLVSLSEQNLIDCTSPPDKGCHGGLETTCFKYVKKNKGIDTEAGYPYMAKMGKCHYDKTKIGATCKGLVRIATGDEEALRKAVSTVGPISAGIHATTRFLGYHGDETKVFNDPDCKSAAPDLNHSVLVVGYGVQGGKPYWLVKNSHGTSFGAKGYIKMSRNKNNQCGIATDASYPLV